MRFFTKKTLREYYEVNTNAEQVLKTWVKVVEKAVWKKPTDVLEMYPRASVHHSRFVFRLNGNHYRIGC